MMSLVAKLTIKEGKEQDFIDAMKDVVPAVRDEPGNNAYIMSRSKDNPRMFVFYEEYTDKAAFDAHRKHLGELGQANGSAKIVSDDHQYRASR